MKHLLRILTLTATTLLAVGCATTPQTETTPQAPSIKSDTVRLIFGGDFMQHMPQVDAARTADGSYDYSRSTEYIAPMFRNADVAVVGNTNTAVKEVLYLAGLCKTVYLIKNRNKK